ncbi:uncharacterized protein LOC142611965 [Castanea sativa]|uniref:uncharacterized protein LOC142611965 n=1 Tax=Castanea sativa TaxID=21020 RepID=UPI003F651115
MGKKTTSNSKTKKARALWGEASWTTIFCNLCVEQIEAGNRIKGAAFSTEGHVTGLGWDAVKGTVQASNDWWDRKLKELPKATKFRLKSPQNLEQLDRMFRDVVATGVATWTPSSNTLPPTIPPEGVGDSDGSSKFKDNQCDMSLDIDSLQQGHTSQSHSSGQKRTSESIHSQKKKKKIRGAAMLDDRISELIKVCQNKSVGTSRELSRSIDNVMEIVRAKESTFVVEASVVLMKRSRREMFLTFKDPESQLQWLQVMIRNQKK